MARWSTKNTAEAATAIAALIMREVSPESEAAKATMQINSGAGLGTKIKLRSTKMAITAVAAVRAGPEISRQSNRIHVLVPTENFFSFSGESNPCSVTVGWVGGRYSRFNPKKRFNEAVRLSDLLYQNCRRRMEPGSLSASARDSKGYPCQAFHRRYCRS